MTDHRNQHQSMVSRADRNLMHRSSDELPTQVEYPIASLNAIQIDLSTDPTKKRTIRRLRIEGQDVVPTDRFVTSLTSNLGISQNIFTLFSPEEVIARAVEKHDDKLWRFALAKESDGRTHALAVSNPLKPIVRVEDSRRIAQINQVAKIGYSNGVVRSEYQPTVSRGTSVNLGGESFINMFVVDSPIDGWGRPSAFVSLLREICTNGAIGYGPAFKSEINLGKEDPQVMLSRFISTFNNEEAYDAIHQRMLTAMASPASLGELHSLYQKITSFTEFIDLEESSGKTSDFKIVKALYKLGGNPLRRYGLVNFESISARKARVIDVDCTVYDLINFCTELTSHHNDDARKTQRLMAWLGQLLSSEYDLENTLLEGDEKPNLSMTKIKNKPFFLEDSAVDQELLDNLALV
jgi:hypothetical protein